MTNAKHSITVENSIDSKIRHIQADLIKNNNSSISYNRLINGLLLAGIMGMRSLDSDEFEMIKRLVDGQKITIDISVEDYVSQLSKLKNSLEF